MVSDPLKSVESLSFELRGEGFALVRIDGGGNRSELILSESNILFLPKIIQETIRKILTGRSSQAMKESGLTHIAAVQAARVQLNTDTHRSEILLTIFDEFENGSSFALPFEVAQPFSARLPARVAEIERARRRGKPS